MSHKIRRKGKKDLAVVCRTPPAKCELCGREAELRPYGPRGENICVQCGLKDVKTTERQMGRVLFGEDVQ